MKLIELTDAFTGNLKEYVDAENVTNIQPRVEYSRNIPFFGKLEVKCVGSSVYTKGSKYPTHVTETPEQIYKMITDKEQVNELK